MTSINRPSISLSNIPSISLSRRSSNRSSKRSSKKSFKRSSKMPSISLSRRSFTRSSKISTENSMKRTSSKKTKKLHSNINKINWHPRGISKLYFKKTSITPMSMPTGNSNKISVGRGYTFPPQREDYIIKKYKDFNNSSKVIDECIKSSSSSVTIYKNKKKILNVHNKHDDMLIETLSVTKSFCALAIMFLIQDKKINSVEDLVSTYIESWAYGEKKDITIHDILTHTSGLDKYWSYENFMWPQGNLDMFLKNTGIKPNVKDISLVIDKTRENGKDWFYNDTATQVIPTLVQSITGQTISKYLKKKLFSPLDIPFVWNKDDNHNDYGPNGLSISSNSLCKVGIMMLNDGMWNGRKILDKKLIDQMTEKKIPQSKMRKDPNFANTDMSGYGFMWYDYNDMKIAMGFLGQQLIISKKNNVVAARILQSRWDEPTFERATNENEIYFNNFKNLIEKI